MLLTERANRYNIVHVYLQFKAWFNFLLKDHELYILLLFLFHLCAELSVNVIITVVQYLLLK